MGKSVRVSAKAIIIEDGKLLMLKYDFPDDILYDLPGGGQNHGETLTEALKRECREEIGAEVQVGDILFVHDFIAAKHPQLKDKSVHGLKIEFECRLLSPIDMAAKGDDYQLSIEWLPIDRLNEYPVHPSMLPQALKKRDRIYIGESF
ncbi:MAG: NUDIX domain-containing protein [Christensenellales bacterium]